MLSTPKYTFSLPLSGTYSQYCQPCPIQAYNQNYSGYQGYNQSYSSYQAQRPLTYQPYQQFLENRNCVPCDQYQQPLTGDNYLRSYQPNYYQSTPYQSTAYNTTPYTAPSYQPAPVVQPSYQSYHSHQNYVQPTSYPTNYSSSYQVSPHHITLHCQSQHRLITIHHTIILFRATITKKDCHYPEDFWKQLQVYQIEHLDQSTITITPILKLHHPTTAPITIPAILTTTTHKPTTNQPITKDINLPTISHHQFIKAL